MDQNQIRKALDLAAGTSQYLFPLIIDQAIRDYTHFLPVLYNAVTKQPWATNTYFLRMRTANPTATWSSTGGQTLPTNTQTTHTRIPMPVAYLYSTGSVTGPMIKAAGSFYDALGTEIEAHSRAMATELSTNIAVGTGNNDMYGILAQIENSTSSLNGGAVVTVSGALSLASLDLAIDEGDNDLIVTSRAVRRKINSLLQAQQQFIDKTEIQAGFRVLTYDGIPIVVDRHWENGDKIALIARADAKLLVHQDIVYEELAKTKDATDFMLKAYMGFALEGRPVELTGFTEIANATVTHNNTAAID